MVGRLVTYALAPLVAFLAIGASAPTFAASFSCKGKLTPVEHTICADEQLSALDDAMKVEYDIVKKNSPDVIPSQRDWLKFGRNRCPDKSCLVREYNSRITDLNKGRFRNWGLLHIPEMAAAGGAGSGVTYQALPRFAPIAKWMQDGRLLENNYAIAQRLYRYPPTLKLVAGSCGTPNAFYMEESETVAVCYELIERLLTQFQAAEQQKGVSETQRVNRFKLGLDFVILHELGHAALHNRREPQHLSGKEGEADGFAGVSLISTAKSEADLTDMLFGIWNAAETFPQDPYALDTLTDEHDLWKRRYYEFACLVAGANANIGRQFVEKNFFSPVKVRLCQQEWRRKRLAIEGLSTAKTQQMERR